MRKQITMLVASATVLAAAAQAQNSTRFSTPVKPASFGIHMNALDYKTPMTYSDSYVGDKKIHGPKDWDYGMGLSFWKGITPNIDFALKLNGNFHDYAGYDRKDDTFKGTEIGIELEPTLNLRPWGDNHLLAPFLTAGVGGGYYSKEFGVYVPTGVGLQVNFNSNTYLLLQSAYRWSLSKDDLQSHLFHSIGVAQSLRTTPRVVTPPPPPPVVDRDNDGVLDSLDRCPDVAGIAALQGCPDADGDGIADMDDKCPNQAGVAKYQGCPIPDTDGDGVNDEVDKCPTVAGLARYQGCPIPDTDGDGVNDEEDKCPTVAGVATNFGCPEIKKEVIEKISFAARNVFFSTGSYKLLSKSNKPLNDVAGLMKADTTLRLSIEGHTDSQGSDEMNQTLSENRAKSVMNYLISKGVPANRLSSAGFGETKPVADNATAAGRAKNRRTEMIVTNY